RNTIRITSFGPIFFSSVRESTRSRVGWPHVRFVPLAGQAARKRDLTLTSSVRKSLSPSAARENGMNQRLKCDRGHEWEHVVSSHAETAEAVLRCPTCNEVGRPTAHGKNETTVPTVHFQIPNSVSTAQDLTLDGAPIYSQIPTSLPQAVAGYTILKELGRGGMGVVYLARQDHLNRLVALKMVLAGQHAAEQERSRFMTEAAAVAKLQHPNIVQIYEVGESEGRPYFSLEYVEGGTLA